MIFIIALLAWFYHVPQLNGDTYDDSIQLERDRYMFQLGLEAYQKLDEKYGAY
jgi:hypothetical protein